MKDNAEEEVLDETTEVTENDGGGGAVSDDIHDDIETPLEENPTSMSTDNNDDTAVARGDKTTDDNDGEKEEEGDDDDSDIMKPLLPSPNNKTLTLSQQLVTSKNVRNMSLWALRLGVLADSVNTVILRPNYPFMVLPPGETNPDSFPTTQPFEFGAAQYFLPLTSQLATALAATFVGGLSDKIGRRPVMLVCVGFGTIGSIAKFFARNSFWGFCAANFVTGLFGATLAIGMAYVSDIAVSRHEKDGMIGSLVAIQMVGATGGGIIAIAMSNVGLFQPLLVGAALNALATIIGYFYLIEPDKLLHMGVIDAEEEEEEEEDAETGDAVATTAAETTTEAGSTAVADDKKAGASDRLDWKVASNILAGSLLDNAGSTGYIPFCLSPLMFNTYLLDFVENGSLPIMTDDAFRWISTLLALMIIPAAAGSTALYERIGAATGCVLGNFFTGVFTIILLLIATQTDPTTGMYALFVTIMYMGFPLTVISQLSTGPMLDRISPASKRGFTQGLNTSIMNLGMAIFPWVFGLMSDGIGVETTIWICIGISFTAAIVNSPLMFIPALKPVPRVIEVPEYSRHIPGEEDPETIAKALRGEWVPPNVLHDINDKRLDDGHQFLVVPYKSYQEDKDTYQLCEMGKHSKEDFQYFGEIMAGYLCSENLQDPMKRDQLTKQIRKARAPIEKRNELASDLGKWFADYLLDAGYQVDDSPFVFKQMIMSAFPRLMKSSDNNELTSENIEQVTLNFIRVYNHYMEQEENSPAIRAFAGAYAYA